MIKINLVPQEILDKELERQRGIQASAAVGLLGVVLLVVSMSHYYKSVRLEKILKEDQAKFDKLQAIVAKVEELERTVQAVRSRLNVMQDLLVNRPLYPRFMEDLLRTLPPGVWLTGMTSTADGNGLKVGMSSKALTSEDVAQWLRTLGKSDVFKEPALTGPITVDVDRTNTFSMSAKYTPSPEAKR
jgi:type IV pilus assembly protein PilN